MTATPSPGAFLQALSLAEVIASTLPMTIGFGESSLGWHMEAMMWDCLTWQPGVSYP